ncbi:hypothetical protein MKX03_006360 [Papaver bracteatum]|nr:hypothetical protein MKX03_006360 [Papaver bracteatum]
MSTCELFGVFVHILYCFILHPDTRLKLSEFGIECIYPQDDNDENRWGMLKQRMQSINLAREILETVNAQQPFNENNQTIGGQHPSGEDSQQHPFEQQEHQSSDGQSTSRQMKVSNNEVSVKLGTIRLLKNNSGAKIQTIRDAQDDTQAAMYRGSPSSVARGCNTVPASEPADQIQIRVPNEKVWLIPQHLPDASCEGVYNQQGLVLVGQPLLHILVVVLALLQMHMDLAMIIRIGKNCIHLIIRIMCPPSSYGGYPPQSGPKRGIFDGGWDHQRPSSSAQPHHTQGGNGQSGGHAADAPPHASVFNAAPVRGSGSSTQGGYYGGAHPQLSINSSCSKSGICIWIRGPKPGGGYGAQPPVNSQPSTYGMPPQGGPAFQTYKTHRPYGASPAASSGAYTQQPPHVFPSKADSGHTPYGSTLVGYVEQPVPSRAGYGYPVTEEAGYSYPATSGYGAPTSGQAGYEQPTSAPVGDFAKNVSPQLGFDQFDSTTQQMYGGGHH